MWEKGEAEDKGTKGTEEWKEGAGGKIWIWMTERKTGNTNDDTMDKWNWLENTKEKTRVTDKDTKGIKETKKEMLIAILLIGRKL